MSGLLATVSSNDFHKNEFVYQFNSVMAGLNGAEERVDDGLMNLDFSRICRLCLNFSREFIDLRLSNGNLNGAHHIIDQIKYCYNVKIDLSEPLPSKICFQCTQILTLFSATKRNIKYSEMMLRNILNIRNANHIINSQTRPEVNLSILQRFLNLSEDHQREQEPSVEEDRPTEDNSPLQDLRISPIQIATVRELYRRQNQVVEDDNDENALTSPNLSEIKDKRTRKRSIENRKTNTESAGAIESRSFETQQDDTNSNTVESSSKSEPSCSNSTNLALKEEKVWQATKTPEEGKLKNTNKKPNSVNSTNKKRPFLIDMNRDLRVKLEILDPKTTKKYLSPSADNLGVSTEGQGGRTSGETTSGKVDKKTGRVIDDSNILSPKVKRMRKSISKW